MVGFKRYSVTSAIVWANRVGYLQQNLWPDLVVYAVIQEGRTRVARIEPMTQNDLLFSLVSDRLTSCQ